jgi:hypothetical protein
MQVIAMKTQNRWCLAGLLGLAVGTGLCGALVVGRLSAADEPAVRSAVVQAADKPDGDERQPSVYELRTYTTLPGRLPALHKRFREHTMRLFEKHGMKNVHYFTPVGKDDTLVYLLAHESRDAADRSWQGFRNDPEWTAARDASEQDGKIVMKVETVFLEPTDYSPKR